LGCSWQKLRKQDIDREHNTLEDTLQKLNARERDARARIEDLLVTQPTPEHLMEFNKHTLNGQAKANGKDPKRGKKRKAD
jgi:hypothetical protein